MKPPCPHDSPEHPRSYASARKPADTLSARDPSQAWADDWLRGAPEGRRAAAAGRAGDGDMTEAPASGVDVSAAALTAGIAAGGTIAVDGTVAVGATVHARRGRCRRDGRGRARREASWAGLRASHDGTNAATAATQDHRRKPRRPGADFACHAARRTRSCAPPGASAPIRSAKQRGGNSGGVGRTSAPAARSMRWLGVESATVRSRGEPASSSIISTRICRWMSSCSWAKSPATSEPIDVSSMMSPLGAQEALDRFAHRLGQSGSDRPALVRGRVG